MSSFRYICPAAFLLAALCISGLFIFFPAAAVQGQTRSEAVAIPLKTTAVPDFAVLSPSVAVEIKPGFKEKSFSLNDAVNAREILASVGPVNQDMIKFLEKNRFLLLPGPWSSRRPTPVFSGHDEMLFQFDQLGGSFQEQSRKPQNARFVGPDVFLHAFRIYINIRQDAVETGRLRSVMRFMLDELLSNTMALKRQTSGASSEKWERLAAQVVVPLILISNGEDKESDTLENAKAVFKSHRSGFSDSMNRKITTELERVYKAEASAPGLLGLVQTGGGESIDYIRFSPPDRYGHKAASRAYYRTMVWLSALGWDLNTPEGLADALNCVLAMSYDSRPPSPEKRTEASSGEASTPAIRKAAGQPQRTADLPDSSDVWQAWSTVMEINNFFLGHQSAPSFQQWLPFLMKEAGVDRFTADTATDEAVLSRLAEASASITKSLPFFRDRRQPQTGNVLCFFPARSPLTGIMSVELTYHREVREDAPTVFSALYLPALMGHKYSRELIARQISLDFTGAGLELNGSEAIREKSQRSATALAGAMDSWTVRLRDLPDQRRFGSLDSAWLHLTGALTREYGAGYPLYMQNTAYQAKQLETVLGSYTECRGGLVFDQPSTLPAGGPEDPSETEDGPAAPIVKGFVEPNPVFWRELIRIVKYTADGFKKHGLFPEDLEESGTLSRFLKRLERCAALSEKELAGQPLTDDEYEFIRLFALDFMAAPVDGAGLRPGKKSAMVADIWTMDTESAQGRSSTVYEANAEPQLMLVMVGNDKSLRLTVGLAYNHYEIIAPYGLRLTNEMWRKLAGADQAGPAANQKPKLPPKNFWYDPLRP